MLITQPNESRRRLLSTTRRSCDASISTWSACCRRRRSRIRFGPTQQPDKRGRLVRRLLDDRRAYADHWLTFWNDLLRNDYAGTGYIDGGRKQITGWLYRSLLDNKPYDQFVRELISPTPESEGFINGIRWRGNVNASQMRELQFAQNVSQVFFGINMKCASCHDSFIDDWKLDDAYGLAAIIADEPLEIHRCDKPTGKIATPRFLFPELGTIDAAQPKAKRLEQPASLLTHAGQRPLHPHDRQPPLAAADGPRHRASGRRDGQSALERGPARLPGGEPGRSRLRPEEDVGADRHVAGLSGSHGA